MNDYDARWDLTNAFNGIVLKTVILIAGSKWIVGDIKYYNRWRLVYVFLGNMFQSKNENLYFNLIEHIKRAIFVCFVY